ncbi:MAG: hypothetical protein U0T81_01245 [Saprospiraceae bacterium]
MRHRIITGEIAIVLDDGCFCAKGYRSNSGGNSQISGSFTIDEAKDLANILQVGKLLAKTRIVQESLVNLHWVSENINTPDCNYYDSFCYDFYDLVLYRSRRILNHYAASISSLIIATLAFSTVLTLPGIAGLVLTMGISVDANVIIYERIKEELVKGKE